MQEASPKKTEIKHVHAIVHGHVQGVGFRATVLHFARQLNLHGTVSNLADGSVEINVIGPLHNIHELFHSLQREFGSSHISTIDQEQVTPHKAYEDFKIIR